MISKNIEKVYNPFQCEQTWYDFWLKKNYFHGKPSKTVKKSFAIVIPPPNITGSLHMGHAVNNILQDVIIRYKKMTGFETLWMPGTDHGGIATQNVVEKMLLSKGKTRHDLGREAFLQTMWQWRTETGDKILMQLRKLGCSCDWDRTCFTMDEKRNNAVYEAFRVLFEKGLIYRGRRMVQWCIRCHTALADIEVEHEEQTGKLWYIMYPFADKKGGIVVATTRPETMLGDTAVAVHPEDERYKDIIGNKVVLPLTDRSIPIIGDEFVDKTFGTGAVKVTPAHDKNDYDIGMRHNLPSVIIIGFDGKMTNDAGRKYAQMDRYGCRKKIIEDLEKEDLLVETKDHLHAVGRCYRCNDTIEPLVSDQWFLSMSGMAKKGINAGVKFIPESWAKPYTLWLENLRDWCISRQIWWGHRIPLWYCSHYKQPDSACKPVFGVEQPKQCPVCNEAVLTQDPDVLDTWFSSALWPFSVFEWPDKTPELDFFYPTSVLVTGHEILYLWVARMVMMGLEFINKIPFEKVLIHGIVRDKKGKKMSKSLGNVIDPLDIAKQYGTDALRYSLISACVMGRDMQLSDESFLGARNFTNKIWNVSRFICMNLEDYDGGFSPGNKDFELADTWILSRFSTTLNLVKSHIEAYNFAQICRILHSFIWSEFCDWYIELAKPRLNGNDQNKRKTVQWMLVNLMDGLLKMLNPIMPFITEEIWHMLAQTLQEKIKQGAKNNPYFDRLDFSHPSLMECMLPGGHEQSLSFKAIEPTMKIIQDMIAGIRNVRSEMHVPPGKKIEVWLHIPSDKMREVVQTHTHYFIHLARIETLTLKKKMSKPKKSAVVVIGNNEIFIPLADLIDVDKEKSRLENELTSVKEDIEFNTKKLDNKNFVSRAPEQEVDKVRVKITTAIEKQKNIELNLKGLSND
ncbi:MAG: valine--tRNA ligase [bacterium]